MTLAALLAMRAEQGAGCLSVPGVWDGFTARLAQLAGFDVLFLSGAALSMARFGKPDLAFHGLQDLASTVEVIANTSDAHLLVDADTGFGNALHVQNTVQVLERAGAAAIQIEDQTYPKRCGHLTGKSVLPIGEATAKIRAAASARRKPATLISARTDALAIEGVTAAIDRALAYREAGADMIFVEGPGSMEELDLVSRVFAGKVPLIHNLVDGGNSPVTTREALSQVGFDIALHPLLLLSALAAKGGTALAHLREQGETASISNSMPKLGELNEMLGLPAYLEDAERYGDGS